VIKVRRKQKKKMAAHLKRMFLLVKKPLPCFRTINVIKQCRLFTSYNNNNSSQMTAITDTVIMNRPFVPCIQTNLISHPSFVPCIQTNLISQPSSRPIELPTVTNSYLEIYDNIPLIDINLPSVNLPNHDQMNVILPNMNNVKEILEPGDVIKDGILCKHGMLKIRRKKMNKHKLKKRKKRDRAKIRKLLLRREKIRRKKRAAIKVILKKKIEKIYAENPKSTYAERPYVRHRLMNW